MTVQAPLTRSLLQSDELEKLFAEAGAGDPADLAEKVQAAIAAQASLDRQQALAQAREAYREGFFAGRQTPRYMPFSHALWRASRVFQQFQTRQVPDENRSRSRYADYEDL